MIVRHIAVRLKFNIPDDGLALGLRTAIIDISRKEKQRALCHLGGVVHVARNQRARLSLECAMPPRTLSRRPPRANGFAAIIDGELIRRQHAGDARAWVVELLLKPALQLSQEMQPALP